MTYLSPSALKKVKSQWNRLLKDGRISMSPTLVAEKFGDEGLRDRFDLPLNEKMHLLTPYPKCLNLHAANLPHERWAEAYNHNKEAFADLDRTGKPPPAHLHLLNDSNVEEIYIPADGINASSYIALENLPNLRKIVISPNIEVGDYPFRNMLLSSFAAADDIGLKWVCCKNLPNLELIEINGGLVWLRVQDVPKLAMMNLANAKKLWYLHIENAPALAKLKIDKCVKLGRVHGMGVEQLSSLSVDTKIKKIQQSKSRLDGAMYKNMTFSDVEYVLNVLNRGWALAATKGLLGKNYKGEAVGIKKMPEYNRWSFNVMKPLASTDTQGTGMTPTFEIYENGFCGEDLLEFTPWGATSPEECLRGAWGTLENTRLANKFNTFPKMLQKLKSLI